MSLTVKMNLLQAMRASNVLTVKFKGKLWSVCTNPEERLDFIADAGGGWCDFYLSQEKDRHGNNFEPFIASEEDLKHPKWKYMHEKYKVFQEILNVNTDK